MLMRWACQMSVACMVLAELCCSDYVAQIGVAENGKLPWCCSVCVAQMMLRRLSSDGVSYVVLVKECCSDLVLLRLVVLKFCCPSGAWHFQVMDSLVVSLSKFTSPLNPLAFKPVVTFGENEKARIATEAVFTVANRYARALHKHHFPSFQKTLLGSQNAFQKPTS